MSDETQNPTSAAEDSSHEESKPSTKMEQFFYHQRRALEETGKALEALLPPGFREHGSEALREFGRGFRILVDATIDELKRVSEREAAEEAERQASAEETPAEEAPKKTTGKAKVKVKVE
ncbi:MAG: hypothetical protein NZ750_02275 [Anaerolineae bacterium]|nr:hypothetical protein [Anaerolineae bacterium]MDW8173494.1 hypothetical protein [Anaerolineae bacterium]